MTRIHRDQPGHFMCMVPFIIKNALAKHVPLFWIGFKFNWLFYWVLPLLADLEMIYTSSTYVKEIDSNLKTYSTMKSIKSQHTWSMVSLLAMYCFVCMCLGVAESGGIINKVLEVEYNPFLQ